MDCLFSRDSLGHLSNKAGNHISPLKGVFMVMMTLFLTMSNGAESWAYPGCTIQGACNYDPDATSNDGSCDFVSCLAFGCTNPSACNYDPDADYNDNSCEYITCAGCMNPDACDYDPEATLAATCTDFSSCYGCTDETAPNYDPTATLDDGSCEVPGCTIVGACNFDPNANVDDNSCDFFSCLPSGCLNQSACNYDPAAVINDGSCVFAEQGYDCDGNCLADTDGDGVCDANEIDGCTDPTALNFDVEATDDDGSCISSTPGCLDPTACNYNPIANQSDDSCEFTSCAGCLSPSACNYDATAIYPAACDFPEAGYDCEGNCLIDNDEDGVCDQFEIAGCTDETACNYDSEATELDGSCDFSTCAGCTNEFGCNYDPIATIDDGSCDFFSCITFGCTNPTACNYDAEANYEDGSCEFVTCAGCTNPAACDYDPEATISAQCQDFTSCLGCTNPEADNYDPAATQDSGNCLFLGCTVSVACNYDANANSDDGSCEYESCAGCLNPIACNYDPEAVLSGTCEFADNGYDCDGNCLEDTDGDGICDPFEVLGCTNPDAVNYDSDATDDDGSCFILTEGCIDPSACNYDETANTDDGSCEFTSCAGCLNESACNYDATAIYPAECEFPEYAYNCDGTCIADNDGDGICNPFEVPGCTASDACNYDPEATDDDGSCDFITCNVPGCTNPFACNYDSEAVINDGSCDFVSCLSFGCTNPSACNYDPEANYNDGSCEYTTCAGCTNPLACDYDPDAIIAAGCNDYSSCYGCTDDVASNFDENATIDDGSCQFPGCTVEGACNYDATANFNDGSCDFFSCLVEGCLNETACNYDPEADLPGECDYPEAGYDCDGNCLDDTDGDGVCDQFEIAGCTDANALNYDPEATEDNGSCVSQVEGCTDSAACNYDITANTDDGSCEFDSCVGCLAPTACNYNADAIYPGECEYPEVGYDCDGNCLSDFDGDGVCDPFEVLGCDDPEALNYDPNATQDDGSCIDIVEGCTNADACNYNPDANVDDESCDFESCIGCLSPEACNYDPNATVAGECVFPELGYDCDGVCLEDADGDGVCDPFEIAGCTDPEACNYNENATDDNGSCFNALDGYDCDGNCLSDQDNDGICDPFELPPLLFIPADTLAECGSELPAATATGGCFEPIVTFEDEVLPGNCEGNFTTLRTWTATDNCGNATSRVQTILFQDTTAPELSVPSDYTAECSDELILDDATATDACSSFEISETSVTTPGNAAGNYVIVRTFTATDDCGNSASATQTITVQDTTAPEFTFVPADYTVECSDEMPMDDATASDNCGDVTVEVSSETTPGDAAGNYVITRTFTATDDAGNSSSATQTITVQDTTAPEFTFVPADYTVECSDEMPMDDATASDNCGDVTVEVSSETTPGDAAGNYVITRTFTATDDAGNSSSATQTITVQDTTAPEFTFVPADYTVECSDEMPMDDATASDNCGDVTVEVSSETTPGDAAGNYVITRTFTATDDAGNSSSATQTITVQDTTAPEFTFVPADYTVECSDEMPMDDATASDNCGDVTVEVSSETTPGDAAGNYVITRTFTATDDAGNSSSATQTITVQDTTAPEFTFVPADYTVECSDDMPMDDATASDNCGEVTVEVSSETTPGDAAGNYVITRTFTATDDAGNSSSATQTITVQDTTAPEFTFVPADYTVECSDDMPMDDATASDNCGDVTVEVSSETTPGDAAGNYVITRTFTATDDAGNSSSATQTITVQDTTAPEFTFVPADYTVECSDEMPMDDATASDNCGDVTVEVSSETTPGDAAGNYVITRTFTATDDAGNSSSATQTITVQDTTAPEFTFVPADYTVECSDEMPMDDATASDNCGDVTVEVSSETTPGDAAGNYVITRTFTATDDAGNSSSATQTITVQDTTAPEFTFVPADYTVECSDEMPMDDATASDNCGDVTVEVSSETTPGDAAGNYVITRTFTATDDAGNSSSATQTITVQDTTAPEFTFVPADYTVECSDDMPMDDATASDNCGEVTVEVSSETTPGDAAGNYVITRTFTATDDAGNSSSATQTITVQDTTAPEFTFVPADYTVECSDDMPMDDATASDNCGDVTVEVSSETTPGDAAGNYVITRTFTATDDAGNSSSATQTITVQDITAPEFTFVPADYTVECSDEMPMDDATASDNCGDVTVEVSSETTPGDAAGNYVITRTFTATDDAGNSSSATQTITVQDTTAPEFTFVPADYTVECSDEMPMDDATASDNCGDVTVEVSSETTPGDAAGNYVITRTFTATDDAGNSSSATQTITVQDTTAPEFTFVPEGFAVSCSSELPAEYDMATATDNCGEVSVEMTSAEIPGDVEGAYTLVLTYTATDDAGNSSTADVEIEVGDTVPEGDCDCDGNQLDAIGVCGGDCLADSDGDGICDLFEVFGCDDETACNYDPEATQNDGSCTYPETGYDCDGECLEDTNENGICDIFEVSGCTDESNPGYNPFATIDDGSCLVGGCLIPSACNYTPDADYQILGFCDFSSCTGCTDAEACNYDEDATVDDGSCDFAGSGLDCEGVCLNDADGDGICDEDEVGGCTDITNPGYNPFATEDDGSCLIGGCVLPFACNYDASAEYLIFQDCDFTSCTGCTDEEACNYDEDATLDDNSCEFPATGLDCNGECLNDLDGDGVCDEDEIAGCTDPSNAGYNPFATDDDGSCLIEGCVIVGACNYDPNAEVLDITACDFSSCAGCTDANACNYDPTATISDGASCTYPASQFVDCDGVCLNDLDGDGVCDEEEIFGCTDAEAVNYNPSATEDNGTCDFGATGGCNLPFACNYDPEADFYLPGSCDFTSCFSFVFTGHCENENACNFGEEGECEFFSCLNFGCTNPGACNYDPEADVNDGSCDFQSCIGCTNPNACDFNPDATIAGQCFDYTSCVGCLDETADNYNPDATLEGNCLFGGCTIPGACNYDAAANSNDGTCDYFSCIGCQNPAACNFDPDAIYSGQCSFPDAGLDCDGNCIDSDGDSVCDNDEVDGCTDANAINYDEEATEDNGTCIASVSGCTNMVACNYDQSANSDDGSCEFETCTGCVAPAACNFDPSAIYAGQCEWPEQGLDCDGNCLADADGDGVCNADEINGCTDENAVNFEPEATEDDGSCIDPVQGCTNMEACNYELSATSDDGSCEFESCAGCLSPTACNYDPTAILAGECEFPEAGFDCDGNCISGTCGGCTVSQACNYNPEATFNDGSCEFISCLSFGCTDENACNFDAEAVFDDGSCEYAQFPYGCDGECVNDNDGDGVCDEFEVFGCTDVIACNYSDAATDDDGSCSYDCQGCTIEGACNFDPNATIDDGTCDFTSCLALGCTEPLACNYDPAAVLNDGSCEYLSCAGCTDANACNYDDTATLDDDSCELPETGYDCEGNCLSDVDGDGVCDEFETEGCTSSCACNYNASATEDDESCVFEGCDGCIYESATNYDENAVFDDGSCEFQGCMDPAFSNYNPAATVELAGDCSNEPSNGDFNNDNIVQLADLLTFLMSYGTSGPEWGMQDWIVESCEIPAISYEELLSTLTPCEGDDCCGNEGCTYPAALNYDEGADTDHGSCLFPGCTDGQAVNFDPLANIDNGTCSYQPCPDFNGDGLVQILDLMDLLLIWGTTYE